MSDLLIRNVPDDDIAGLKSLAAGEGISVVEFLREMISARVNPRCGRLGLLAGVVSMPPDEFFAPLDDAELDDWYGR